MYFANSICLKYICHTNWQFNNIALIIWYFNLDFSLKKIYINLSKKNMAIGQGFYCRPENAEAIRF